MSAAAIPPRRALPLRLALVLTTTVGIGAPTVPCAAAQAAKAEVRSYPLGLRDSATTATIVRRLLSAAGTVVEDPAHNRLVVYDRPDVHRRIAEALEAMAVGARQVRITVTEDAHEDVRRDGASVAGGTGGVSVGGGAWRSSARSATQQQILVLSGGRGSIRVAEQVPYSDWFWTWGVTSGAWVEGTRWQDVGTSLTVEPTVLDDQAVRLRLTPEFSYLRDGERRMTEVRSLSTEVVVRSGDEVDIGGLPLSDRQFSERFLVGFDRAGRTQRVRLRLKATIE